MRIIPRCGSIIAALIFLFMPLSGAADDAHDSFEWLPPILGVGADAAHTISVIGSIGPSRTLTISVTAKPNDSCILLFGPDVNTTGVTKINGLYPVTGGKYVISNSFHVALLQLNAAGIGSKSIQIGPYPPPRAAVQAACTSNLSPTPPALPSFRVTSVKAANRGNQWVAYPKPSWSDRSGLGAVVAGPYLYVLSGRPGFWGTNDVHRFDGSAWTQLLADNPNATDRFSSRYSASVSPTELDGKMWILLGAAASGDASDMWSSKDGFVWTKVSDNVAAQGGPSARNNAPAVVFNGKLWVMGGYHKGSDITKPLLFYLNDVYAFDPQTGWKKYPTPPWKGRHEHRLTVHNGRIYLAGGSTVKNNNIPYEFDGFNDVWSTADGINWKQETPAAPFMKLSMHALISYNGLQISGGYQSTFNYQWNSNDNGANWAVPLEFGGPGYSFGNQPISSAAKDAMPDLVRYGAVGVVYQDRAYSLGGFTVSGSYNSIVGTE